MDKKSRCVNKKLHPYLKTGIYGWLGEEVDDNDYMICPICDGILAMNYWDYSAEHDGDNKCFNCGQELDYSEIYDFEDTLYFRQLLEMKEDKIADLEAKLAESEKEIASLEVCLLESKNNMKEMQEFKIGEDEYDLTDEDARNDLRDYIQEFEKVSKRVYEQKEYAEKILRMSTSEEHQEILQLKQQLAEKDIEIERLKQNYDEVWEDTYFSVRENFELNNNCNECRRCYAEEFNKQLAEKEKEEIKRMGDFEKRCQEYYGTDKYKRDFAITELEKAKAFIIKNNDPTQKMTKITRFINEQVNRLKGETNGKNSKI